MPTQFGQLQPVCIHHTARPSLIHLAQVLGGRVDWFQSVLEQTLQVYFIDYPLSDNVERLHGESARSLQVNTCSCLPPIAPERASVACAFTPSHRVYQDPAGQFGVCIRGRHYQTG